MIGDKHTLELMPMRSDGRDYEMNLVQILTASLIISWMRSVLSLFCIWLQRWQAKSVCNPSSLEISSFENVSPGISDLFFSQNIAQNDPEKKMPSTAAKATSLSWKVFLDLSIHFIAHWAFSLITSMFETASKRNCFSLTSLMQVSMRREQVQLWMFSMAIWKPQKHLAYGIWTYEQNCSARFSRTMPSLAAKKARTYLMKCRSCSVSLSQSLPSWQRSISSAVQKEAKCFLYISQIE